MACCSSSSGCCAVPLSADTAGGSGSGAGGVVVETIVAEVEKRYGEVAREEMNKKRAQAAKEIAASFGYSEDDLSQIPEAASLGLSCGNPIALAHLKEGDVVVDLGSGGGMDCFLASSKVGDSGKVIGVDMTQDMISLAQSNAAKRKTQNVEFRMGRIESLPIDDNSVDVVISNCVINLVPDKKKAYSEIFRVLKPGGRVAISDIAFKQAIPDEIKSSVEAFIGCIAGAQLISEMERDMRAAGFTKISIIDSKVDLSVYAKLADGVPCCASSSCGDSPSSAFGESIARLLSKYNINDYAMSAKVYALKD